MNRKNLFTFFTTAFLLISAPLMAAESGIFFDPDRNGEGATIFVDDNQAVLFFYTYCDESYDIPPAVSPLPPLVELDCANEPLWFLAQSSNFDGETGDGSIFMGEAINYPNASSESTVAAIDTVGTFTLIRSGDGFEMTVDWVQNPFLPQGVNLYNSTFFFTSPLLKIND